MSFAAPEVEAVVARWCDALNAREDRALVMAAVTPNATIWPYADDTRRQEFEGHEAIAAWLAQSPAGVRFSPRGPVTEGADGTWCQPYAIQVEDFHNQGLWVLEVAGDGRIQRLEHRPQPLDEST